MSNQLPLTNESSNGLVSAIASTSSSIPPSPPKSPTSSLKSPDPSSSLPSKSHIVTNSPSETSSASETPVFVLHRRLHLRNLPGYNPVTNGNQSGVEIFTSNTCKLDREALKAAVNLKDTDIVQVHYPVVLESTTAPSKHVLSEIAPVIQPQPSSSKHVLSTYPLTNGITTPSTSTALVQGPSAFEANVPMIPDSGLHGPSVTSLYYSPYSSFAPQYDSTGSLQTCEQARTSYLSRQRLDRWIRRKDRYIDVTSDGDVALPSSTSNLLDSSELRHPRRSFKRQRVDYDTSDDCTSEATDTKAEDRSINTWINHTLSQNHLLIRNLQERQYDRLREATSDNLDPSLSASVPSTSIAKSHQTGKRAAKLSSDELADADHLMTSLSELLQLRPHVSTTHDQSRIDITHDPEISIDAEDAPNIIIPSREILRSSQHSLIHSGTDLDPDPGYSGCLPSNYGVAIQESVLTSQSDTHLLELLTNKQGNGDAHPNGGPMASHTLTPQQTPPVGSSPQPSYRDPALLQQHVNQVPLNFRPPFSDHMKMNLHTPNGGTMIQPPSIPGSLLTPPVNPSPMIQAHHYLVQSQRMITGSPFRMRPGISSPSPQLVNKLPNIASSNMTDHPNHRALASKMPIHSPFNTTANRIT